MAVSLEFEEISDIILEITSGKRITNVLFYPEPVVFHHPESSLKLYLNFFEKNKVKQYLSEGYLSELELESNPELQAQVFSVEDQEELEEVTNKIKAYSKILKKKDKNLVSYTDDLEKLNKLKLQENQLLNKKKSLDCFSAEYKAREDKFIYLLERCVLNIEGLAVFKDLNNLDSTIYTMDMLYTDLNNYLDFYFGYNTSIIRQIARSYQWKLYFIGCLKNLKFLFNRGVEDLSIDQINLMSWSLFYSNIDDMTLKDRPNEDIINNDEQLDEYMKEYNNKINAEIALSKVDKGSSKQDHVIVTAESSNYVKYHKNDLYSDTALISGKAKSESTEYNETSQIKKIKKKLSR